MSIRSALGRSPDEGPGTRTLGGVELAGPGWLSLLALALVAGGVVCWAVGAGLVAMWLFTLGAAAVALVLPFPLALVSPLFMGILGWLVDMLPFVVLAGWAAAVGRWAFGLLRQRRLPTGGKWILIPIGLVVWTAIGVSAIDLAEWKHFLLLFGIQVLASGAVLAAVDSLGDLESRIQVIGGVLLFIVLLTVAVVLQYAGISLQDLQDESVSARAEAAYGLDAFPNDVGMVKYTRARNAGAYDLRVKVKKLQKRESGLPDHQVFIPISGAYGGVNLLVRFEGSARPYEDELNDLGINLVFDGVGIAPASTVPRLRSFPRNPLTYAGICAALFPFAFFLAWNGEGRRRLLGSIAIAACLVGAGFALARGAWVVIVIGGLYLVVDGRISWKRKLQYFGAVVAGAVLLTAVFLVKYDTDPMTARAGAKGSVTTREDLYRDTVSSVSGRHLITGYGTTKSRTSAGTNYARIGKYIPQAGTHSTYLNYLFRVGVPGAVGILALYLIAGLHARARARSSDGAERSFSTLAAAAVVIVGAHGLILSLYVEPIYTLTISLIIGIAIAGALNLSTSVWPWRTRATA